MSLQCLVGLHAPLPPAAANQGFQFSRCRRCGCDMVRAGKSWRRVPKGFRVVWKPRDEVVSAASPKAAAVPAPPRMPARTVGFPRLEGLIDLVRAALRVLYWAGRDHMRSFARTLLALPRPARAALQLPAR